VLYNVLQTIRCLEWHCICCHC